MSRTFCCCLPVRLGVFVLSTLQFIVGGLAAGAIWFTVAENHNLGGTIKTAFIVAGAIYSALALAAFMGFIGAAARNRGLVAVYSTVLYVMMFLQLASGIWLLYMLYHDGGAAFLQSCQDAADNASSVQVGQDNVDVGSGLDSACDGIVHQARWLYIVQVILTFFIQLYCAVVVGRYVQQLSEEQVYRNTTRAVGGAFAPPPASYYPHAPLAEQKDALLHPPVEYPYADKQHSFGAPV